MTKTTRPATPEFDVDFAARCAPWAGLPAARWTVSVDVLGDVRVYDSIAGHFTGCHSLSAAEQARLVRRACKIARD